MTYFAYTRVSTITQAEKGFGLEAQKAAISEYAQKKGIEISGWFEDAGISANIHDEDDDDEINKRKRLMNLFSVL